MYLLLFQIPSNPIFKLNTKSVALLLNVPEVCYMYWNMIVQVSGDIELVQIKMKPFHKAHKSHFVECFLPFDPSLWVILF